MGTAIGSAIGAQAAANPAAVSTGLKGGLAKLGNLFGFSSPWGAIAWGAIITGNILLNKFLRRTPKTDVTRRETTLPDEDVVRRWIVGLQRRVSGKLCYASIVPPTSAAQAIEGSYKSNHLRLIFILSEGAIGDVKGVYIDDSKYIPLTKTGNILTPTHGYTLPSDDVSQYAFPQNHVIRLRQFLSADGSAQPSIQINPPSGRKYHDTTMTVAQTPNDPEDLGWIDESVDSTDFFSDYYNNPQADQTINPPQDQQIPFYQEGKPWTEDHVLDGVSYVAVELFQPFHQSEDANDDYWKRIPKIEFVTGGLKFNTPANPTTAVESENPIDQLYWYDTEVLKIPASKINLAAYNAARAICEETVTFDRNQLPENMRGYLGTYRSFKKYTANHIIEEGENQEGVHARLLAACAGARFWHNGEVHYLAGKDTASVLTLTDSELEDIVEVRPWPSVADRYNQITATISQNKVYSYKEDTYVFTDTAARTRDGELRNLDIELECIDHPLQAGYLLAILERQQRQSFTFSAVIPPLENMDQLTKIIPGATVTITASEIGLNARECIVQSVQVRADFRVLAIFKLKNTGVYDETLITPEIRPRGIQFSGVIVPDPPEGLSSDEIAIVQKDGSIAVRLEVTYANSESPITQVQARVKSPQGDWIDFVTAPYGNKAILDNVKIGETYEIRARHWSSDNVESAWVNLADNTIDGDLTPPSALTDFAVSSLPNGIHAQWENPPDDDFDSVNIYVSEEADFTANESTLVANLKSNFYEELTYVAGRRYYIKAAPVDTSGNIGTLTAELNTTPTVQAAEGVQIFSGAGVPSPTLGNNDDLYLQLNGNLWQKRAGSWVNTGIDLTEEGANLVTFSIASTEAVPRPMPNITATVGSIAFNLANGQYWERTDAVTWTYRGDLTGPEGPQGAGFKPFGSSLADTEGENGDYTIDPATGNWYLRENNQWVLQGDLSGNDGARWFTYQGSAEPPSTTFNGVSANIGDFALSTTTHRYYELTASTTWTLRGDLAAEVEGSKIVFFSAALGANPNTEITQQQANIGDEAINTNTAEYWEKTADPNTWILRGDLGSTVTIITTSDPPADEGTRIGDLAFADVDSRNRKLYAWELAGDDTEPSWVFQGYFRGQILAVDDSVPTDLLTGDTFWDEDGDVYCIDDDGNAIACRTVNRPPIEGGGNEVDTETQPLGCKVYRISASSVLTATFGDNGDAAYNSSHWYRKLAGQWVRQTPDLASGTVLMFRREELPTINYNTPGWRALNPPASRSTILCVLFPSTDVWRYNYDTDTWTKVVKLCVAAETLPSAPTNFRRTALTYPSDTEARATVNWNTVSGATGYRLRIVPTRNVLIGLDTINVASSATSQVITGLRRGVDYTIYINVTTASGTSPEDNLEFSTDPTPVIVMTQPNRVATVTATPSTTTQGSVTVNITAGAVSTTKPIDRTVVRILKDGVPVSGKSQSINYVAGTSTYSHTFTGLAVGTNYRAQAYHVNSAGTGQARNSSAFSIPTIGSPDTPQTLNAPTNWRMLVRFNADDTEDLYNAWTRVVGATSYTYSFSPSSAFVAGTQVTGTVTRPIITLELSKTSDNTTVTGTVRAVAANQQSPLSTNQITINIDSLATDTQATGNRAMQLSYVQIGGISLATDRLVLVSRANSDTTNLLGHQIRIERKRGSGNFTKIWPTASEWQTYSNTSGNLINHAWAARALFANHQVGDVYLIRARWRYSDGNGTESTISFRVQD